MRQFDIRTRIGADPICGCSYFINIVDIAFALQLDSARFYAYGSNSCVEVLRCESATD
jgi:hypothetical protein